MPLRCGVRCLSGRARETTTISADDSPGTATQPPLALDDTLADRSLPLDQRLEGFPESLARFSLNGRKTLVEERNGLTYFVNEYWTARQRQGHSIHEVSYRACFKPQLPEFFISALTEPGETVYDPFMGRGTTPIQAALMQRIPFGNDINPLSTLMTRPRLTLNRAEDVVPWLDSLDLEAPPITDSNLLVFFHPETLSQLTELRRVFTDSGAPAVGYIDPVADWVRMVTINRLTGHSSGFLSGRSLPPNQAVSIASQARINQKLGQSPPPRDVKAVIAKKSRSLLRDGAAPLPPRLHLSARPAEDTPDIATGSVDLVVTSPPFLDIVDYAADNWLRCWFAGIDVNDVSISMHRSERAWIEMVQRVLAEQARVLRPGRYVAFEVGEVRNASVSLELLVREAAIGLPMEIVGVMVNDQNFTKTSNIWGVSNSRRGTNSNRIVLLRRT